ncbi:hypothetical protein PTI45_04621 [Paenibacillus nuruki]|uniref:Thymidylate kinase n=1 Tax=Paenibacillus nuruki TaxID=1886670 RepID=A0A1E3KYR3_9BACL|nr:hypothetical protein [Paenibacillus nuruki]ODP26035.1 hypothetical protein PTI45_04621 [Paenibacillus nuruki]
MLIEISGIDGSGKTTIIDQLRNHFNASPLTWAYERNFKNRGKRLLEHISLLHGKDRAEELFDPNLIEFHNALELTEEAHKNFYYTNEKSGIMYFVDKYYTSWISQALLSDISILKELQMIYNNLPLPNVSIYLDVDPAIALMRLQNRMKGDQILNRKNPLKVLEKMRNSFETIHQSVPYEQYRINANEDLNKVLEQVLHFINIEIEKQK